MKNDNSFVAMEQAVCPICLEKHDTGILIHKQLKHIDNQVTHMDLCPKHKQMSEKYIALVAIDDAPEGDRVNPEDVKYSGIYAHVRRSVAGNFFNFDPEVIANAPMTFVSREVLEQLSAHMGGGATSEPT